MLESDPATRVLHFVRPDTASFCKRTSMKIEQRLDRTSAGEGQASRLPSLPPLGMDRPVRC